jgi:hypothetical protein
MRNSRFTQFICATLIASILLAAMPVGLALAGDCDGTVGDDNGVNAIVCTAIGPVPDADYGLGLGDDEFTLDGAADPADSVTGDGLEDGTVNTGNGGNDTLQIDGLVVIVIGDSTVGAGGDDSITVDGFVLAVIGDGATGDGGNDTIIVNGAAIDVTGDSAGDGLTGDGGNDTIIINGSAGDVTGDDASGDGGNDTIIINGTVDYVIGDGVNGNGGDDTIIITYDGFVLGDITGDCTVTGDGGDDYIAIDGIVVGDVIGDCSGGAGGDDTVVINDDGEVDGLIDGEDGFDTLAFDAITQADLNALGLDPAAGSITIGGITYTWANFESLIGLLVELAERLGLRILYQANHLLATADAEGIGIYAEHGRIAYVAFENVAGLQLGDAAMVFQTGNAEGWYVSVANVGVGPNGNSEYQVSIFNPTGTMVGQFSFFN